MLSALLDLGGQQEIFLTQRYKIEACLTENAANKRLKET